MNQADYSDLLAAAWEASQASEDGSFATTAVTGRLGDTEQPTGDQLDVLEQMGVVTHQSTDSGRRWSFTPQGEFQARTVYVERQG